MAREGFDTGSRAPELDCRDAREDVVALQRDELSPLRAEAVRTHLASCPDCREEAMDLELGVRTLARLPDPVPSPDLVDVTMRRVREAREPAPAQSGPVAPRLVFREHVSELYEAQRPRSVLFRPVRSPFVRAAVAAALLLAVLLLANERVAEAAGRAGQRILGPRVSEKLEQATDAILRKFRL